ncbi:hypothetical protein GHK46_07190 [Sinorhizobium medicae]|uniref:hypothetical protein n=1 Tax=Sinorhizobium medicae TaxID=110321 RepID=UPI001296E13F|nr:hypothetical protein [Sinorhizobium medicae]MQV97202.1 hypothetical protein [Sinorhizobium medicae]
MKLAALRTMSVLALTFALQGSGTSAPASADGLRRMVGTDLIGGRGATPADQRKIDRTVVGICAAAVWTEGECARHGEGAECRRNIRL